jgi:hypothetical protein
MWPYDEVQGTNGVPGTYNNMQHLPILVARGRLHVRKPSKLQATTCI